MPLKLVSFQMEHLRLIHLRDADEQQAELFKKIYDTSKGHILAWTLLDENDIPVALGGISFPWPHVADAFMAFSEDIEHDPEIARQVFWGVKRIVRLCFEAYGLHRMEAATPDEVEGWKHWMELMGFESEGVMKKFDPQGNDYMRFAKVV